MKDTIEKFMFKLEQKLVFYPMKKTFNEPINTLKDKIEDIYFKSKKNTLNAWYIPPQQNNPVVIYCHGQSENISSLQEPLEFLAQKGIGFFAVDYTGHGKSSGSPYEKKIYSDIDASVEYLKKQKNIDKTRIIIWGRSLGGAVAAEASTRHNFLGTIIESSFTNIKDAALSISKSYHKALTPLKKFIFGCAKYIPLTQKFDTYSKIDKVKSPLLIIHSKKDLLIDYNQAIKNAQKADFAQLVICENGGHDNSSWAFEEIFRFIDRLNRVEALQPLSDKCDEPHFA